MLKLADIIKSDTEQMDAPFSSWPPLPEEVDYHHVKLPKLLKLLMISLLSKSFPVAARVERLSNSLGQDIIYNMSNGKIKIIKHVQLGITTMRKTRSRLMLASLNRLGHSISYDEVNNVKTSFAELNVKNQSNRSFMPNNVQPSSFVTFVYDNCDHNPETFSGGSPHVTNGIIIQLSSKTKEPEQSVSIATPELRPRRRSFKPIIKENVFYTAPERVNPLIVEAAEMKSNEIHEILAKREDLIWFLTRYKSSEFSPDEQKVPGWTGFYHQVLTPTQDDNHISKTFYLASIAQPPTKISTVQGVLCQVKQKAEALKNKEADFVLDHAIYCKVLEVIMDTRNLQLRNFVNLRIGAFHASCIFIAAIGKRFRAAGLKDVCIEGSLIGIGSVDRVLKGKQYNKGVRALKIIYEALQRLKLKAFKRWLRKENKEDILVDYLESTELLQLINNTKKNKF